MTYRWGVQVLTGPILVFSFHPMLQAIEALERAVHHHRSHSYSEVTAPYQRECLSTYALQGRYSELGTFALRRRAVMCSRYAALHWIPRRLRRTNSRAHVVM